MIYYTENMPNVKTNQNVFSVSKPLIQKEGVVLLSLSDYNNMVEDLEMLSSKTLAKNIEKSRQEVKDGKVYTLSQAKKMLDL